MEEKKAFCEMTFAEMIASDDGIDAERRRNAVRRLESKYRSYVNGLNDKLLTERNKLVEMHSDIYKNVVSHDPNAVIAAIYEIEMVEKQIAVALDVYKKRFGVELKYEFAEA